MIKCPCVKECPSRRVGCRDNCEPFILYDQNKRDEYQKRANAASINLVSEGKQKYSNKNLRRRLERG